MGKEAVIKPEECLGGRLGIWFGYKKSYHHLNYIFTY